MTPPLKVLVVEDDPTTRKIIERTLTRDLGLNQVSVQVVLAADGVEGLERFRTVHPDLIITDLLMPKLDGFKLLETVRATPEGKTIPVIVLTAVFRDRSTQVRVEREYNAVLQNKPFSPKQLAKQVLSMLPASFKRPPAPVAAPATAAAPPEVAAPPRSAARARPPDPAPPPRYQREGTLAEMPVARLLLEISAARFSGSLDLRRGKARKLVHFFEGQPIFVQSNLRGETLGQMLIRRGVLTPAQNTEALQRAEQDGIKYGEALVRLRLMTEAQVMDELTSQTRFKIESCLAWSSGCFGLILDPDIGQKVPRCPVDPVALVFEGLRRHPDLDDAFSRLGKRGTATLALRPEFECYREAFIACCGRRLVDAITPGRTVAEVIQAAGAPHEAVLQIDALLQCGLATLADARPATPAEASALSRPVVERSITLAHLATLAPEPALAPPLSPADEDSAVIRLADFRPRPRPTPSEDPERVRVALQLIQAMYLGLHDANHYQILGVTPHTDPSSIEVAYKIKRRQFDASAFRDVDLGEHRGRLDEISAALDEAYAVLAEPLRRSEYDRGLQGRAPQRARNSALRAEELCREGEQLVDERKFADAEVAFSKATQLDDQPQYHALLALARFMASGCSPQVAEESMVEIQMALAADPGETTCYLVTAKIGRSLGHTDEAVQSLQKLIKLDPSCQEGFDELEDLLLEEGRSGALEVEYRRTLHLLGDQDPAWAGMLWHRLALLYRDSLSDKDRARLACAAALRLKPKDRDLQALLAELTGEHPDRWPEAVLGYRSLLRSDATQAEPLHQLFQLHLRAGRLDAAFLAACAAELRGKASLEESAFLDERRPRTLVMANQPLSAATWDQLLHPDDDQALASLFELLGPALERHHELRLADFDVDPGELLHHETLPGTFRAALDYVATELGVVPPTVALKPQLGADVQVLATHPPVLLVGDTSFGSENRRELTFRIARALAPLRSGRRFTLGRPRRLLRAYLLAAVSISVRKAEVPDVDGATTQARHELQEIPDLAQGVRAAVIGLRQRSSQLNLSDWQRGIQRSAERVALLLAGDLCVAGRALHSLDPEGEVELVDFALSETLGELRLVLGLALR